MQAKKIQLTKRLADLRNKIKVKQSGGIGT